MCVCSQECHHHCTGINVSLSVTDPSFSIFSLLLERPLATQPASSAPPGKLCKLLDSLLSTFVSQKESSRLPIRTLTHWCGTECVYGNPFRSPSLSQSPASNLEPLPSPASSYQLCRGPLPPFIPSPPSQIQALISMSKQSSCSPRGVPWDIPTQLAPSHLELS